VNGRSRRAGSLPDSVGSFQANKTRRDRQEGPRGRRAAAPRGRFPEPQLNVRL